MGINTQDKSSDEYWMSLALAQAQLAYDKGEVPVGAVLVIDHQCVAVGHNQVICTSNPCGHAEILCLQAAGQTQQNYRLPNATLYVTLEPCTMCFGAMTHARLQRLVYGAAEPKAGVVTSQLQLPKAPFYNHRFEVEGGILGAQCGSLISAFFTQRRALKKTHKAGL